MSKQIWNINKALGSHLSLSERPKTEQWLELSEEAVCIEINCTVVYSYGCIHEPPKSEIVFIRYLSSLSWLCIRTTVGCFFF